MSLSRASRSSWLGAYPVFLLEIHWNGKPNRFSTRPITITDNTEQYQYRGKLADPQFELRSDLLGVDVEASSIPIAVVFDDTDITARHMSGDTIDGAVCELSYVLADDATYEQRILIATGVVSQPVYGHPDQPRGYIEFSIESDAVFLAGSLMDGVNSFHIVDDDLLDGNFFNIFSVENMHRGKTIPIFFGETLTVLRPLGNTAPLFTVPAYFLGTDALDYIFTCAVHQIEATTGTISDSNGNTVAFDVTKAYPADDRKASTLTLCNLDSGATGFTDLINPLTDNNMQYWINFSAGGLPNPFGDGALTGAGDVCLWALTSTKATIDFNAWYGVKEYLNRYKLAGVIQDPTINGYEWLKLEVLPYLPVNVVLGPKGLKPTLNLLAEGHNLQAVAKVKAGGDFYQSSPITTTTEPEDIMNDITIRYAYEGLRDAYRGHIRISSDRAGASWTLLKDEYAYISKQRFGSKLKELELNYVYDYKTAIRIARDMVRFHSLPLRVVDYTASSEYGYLVLGDIIDLTDTELGLSNQKVQLLAKKWNGASWLLTLQIEDNPISNRRALPA